MTSFNKVFIDLEGLGFEFYPNVAYTVELAPDFAKDANDTTNLQLDAYSFTASPVTITGQVSEYKANVMNITLTFSRAVNYRDGVVRLFHSDSTLIQTWDSADLSSVNGGTSLVLSITDPLNTLDRFTDYYVELEDGNFISLDRVLTLTNSWTGSALSFTFNTGDHDILPYSALVASAGTISAQLTYNVGFFTANLNVQATVYSNSGFLLEDSATMSAVSSISCDITRATLLPEPLYYDHEYNLSTNSVVFDSSITTAQDLDLIDHIIDGPNGYTYTVVITPSPTTSITSLSSTSSLGTQSFNSSTKVLTLTGNQTQMNDLLDNLKITLNSTESSFTLTYSANNNQDSQADSRVISCNNTVYPTFTTFDFFHGVPNSSNIQGNHDRSTGSTKNQLYAQYNSSTHPWINDDYFLDVSNGIYNWRVPETATYTVIAKGAGVSGALLEGEFDLTKDDEIEILIGKSPTSEYSSTHVGTGGFGGTFVVKQNKSRTGSFGKPVYGNRVTSNILIIAGGAAASTTEYPLAAGPTHIYATLGTTNATISASRTITVNNVTGTYGGSAQGGYDWTTSMGNGKVLGSAKGGFGGGGAARGTYDTANNSSPLVPKTTQYKAGGGGYRGGYPCIFIGNNTSIIFSGSGGSSYSNSTGVDNRWNYSEYYNTGAHNFPHPYSTSGPSGTSRDDDYGYVTITKQP